ncbi:MAG: hypothetical protein ACYC6Y_16000 [Thermoguttaceae bacterium]
MMTAPTTTPLQITPTAAEERFAANDVRLSLRGWLLAAALLGLAFWLVPLGWQQIEPLRLTPDYRVPYSLGNDYWNYRRASREVCRQAETVLVGDSVMWGHYVGSGQTLSHYLGEKTPGLAFANLGVDGIHPVALSGLVDQFGDAIRNRRVILNCNLLWMSSPRHDLSAREETPFNHPALVPQFATAIPVYKATLAERLAVIAGRHFRYLGWADHIRIAYFGSDELATWTFEHPYDNPLRQVTLALPSPDELPSPEPDPRPWTEKSIRRTTPDWVPLEQSLQWRFFRKTVRSLQERGNRVFVMIGPINEHMLTEKGLAEYNQRKLAIATWHQQEQIPFAVPEALPSQLYADLSHPTAEGYSLLADKLIAEESFRNFLQ